MGSVRFGSIACLCLVPALLVAALVGSADAQALSPNPSVTSAPPEQFLAPSNLPGERRRCPCQDNAGSDSIPVSSAMFRPWLPRIPNLDFGFLYSIGPNVSAGRLSVDYLYPLRLGSSSVLFGEAHGEFQNFWKWPSISTVTGSGSGTSYTTANDRTDLSFGGGFRTLLGDSTFIGVNAFYDTSRFWKRWYSSGGVGLEMVGLGPGDSAIDLNFNYYGNIFTSQGLLNAFRNRGGSWDVEAGLSTPLFDQAFDLRLKLNGYQFNIGEPVFGFRTGGDLTTRDGMFTVRYEYGQDRVNSSYHTVGAFVKTGFQVENIFKGASPFTMPEPIFASPRNLWNLLTAKVKRNWHQPTPVVLSRGQSPGPIPPPPPPPPPECGLPKTIVIPSFDVYGPDSGGWVPFPGLQGVSNECLKYVQYILYDGYTVTGECCAGAAEIYIGIAQRWDETAPAEAMVWTPTCFQWGPPNYDHGAAGYLYGMGWAALGVMWYHDPECYTYRVTITNLRVTFVPY